MFRRKDFLVWHYTNRGEYSVKSEYYIARKLHESYPSMIYNSAGTSSSQSWSALWKKVWSIPLPRKLSIFLWILLKDRLPCNALLHEKIMHVDP